MSKSGAGLGDTMQVSRKHLNEKVSKSPSQTDVSSQNFGLFSTINVSGASGGQQATGQQQISHLQDKLRSASMAELHGLSKMAKTDAQLFVKRITFIKKQLDVEPGPMRAISRDHSRTNRNGLKLDYLDAVGRREVPPVDYAEAYS